MSKLYLWTRSQSGTHLYVKDLLYFLFVCSLYFLFLRCFSFALLWITCTFFRVPFWFIYKILQYISIIFIVVAILSILQYYHIAYVLDITILVKTFSYFEWSVENWLHLYSFTLPHGLRSLVGYSPWGRKELDTTERLHFHFHSPLS